MLEARTLAPSAKSEEADWAVPRQLPVLVAFKIAAVAASGVLFLALAFRAGAALVDGRPAWIALATLLAGYLAADLFTGAAHWLCDTFFRIDTPVIGRLFIQPFREHHVHPQRIARYRFIDQDATSFFLMLAPLAAALSAGSPRQDGGAALLWHCALLGLSIGLFGTNLFHKWAHATEPPAVARWLQTCGLILRPARHAFHHRDPTRGFCVTSGWLNPLLDAVRLFPRLETAVRSIRR